MYRHCVRGWAGRPDASGSVAETRSCHSSNRRRTGKIQEWPLGSRLAALQKLRASVLVSAAPADANSCVRTIQTVTDT